MKFHLILLALMPCFVAVLSDTETKRSQGHLGDDWHSEIHRKNDIFASHDDDFVNEIPQSSSPAKLEILFSKIDQDQDYKISESELINWIRYLQDRSLKEYLMSEWEKYGLSTEDLHISWDLYKEKTYGSSNTDTFESEMDHETHIKRDDRRWKAADVDKDGQLSQTEFQNFLRPEGIEHLKDILTLETFEDLDTDKDGKISEDEFVGDMHQLDDDDKEPDWVESERMEFRDHRDFDKDKYLNMQELQEWILPAGFDTVLAEAQHLIQETDMDMDGTISIAELLDKSDIFFTSQATEFGEFFDRHDEL